jgi:hypothetical protein
LLLLLLMVLVVVFCSAMNIRAAAPRTEGYTLAPIQS